MDNEWRRMGPTPFNFDFGEPLKQPSSSPCLNRTRRFTTSRYDRFEASL